MLLLPRLGLLTSEERGSVPGYQVRDRISDKVKSARGDLFQVNVFGSFVLGEERHVSWVHEVNGQKRTSVYLWDLHSALHNSLLFHFE